MGLVALAALVYLQSGWTRPLQQQNRRDYITPSKDRDDISLHPLPATPTATITITSSPATDAPPTPPTVRIPPTSKPTPAPMPYGWFIYQDQIAVHSESLLAAGDISAYHAIPSLDQIDENLYEPITPSDQPRFSIAVDSMAVGERKNGHFVPWFEYMVRGFSVAVPNATLDRGFIWTQRGVLLTHQQGCYSTDAFKQSAQVRLNERGHALSAFQHWSAHVHVDQEFEQAVWLSDTRWGGAFFHVLAETMPSIPLFPAHLLRDPKTVFLISELQYPNLLSYFTEVLQIPRERLRMISGEGDFVGRFKTLWLGSGFTCGCPPRPRIRALRDLIFDLHPQLPPIPQHALSSEGWRLMNNYHKAAGSAGSAGSGSSSSSSSCRQQQQQRPPIILFARRHGSSRSVSNEQQIMDQVRAEFEAQEGIIMAEHRGSDDAMASLALFARADGVIGWHGAGLSHLIMVRDRVPVMEISPDHMYGGEDHKRYNPTFAWIAGALNGPFFLYRVSGNHMGYFAPMKWESFRPFVKQFVDSVRKGMMKRNPCV